MLRRYPLLAAAAAHVSHRGRPFPRQQQAVLEAAAATHAVKSKTWYSAWWLASHGMAPVPAAVTSLDVGCGRMMPFLNSDQLCPKALATASSVAKEADAYDGETHVTATGVGVCKASQALLERVRRDRGFASYQWHCADKVEAKHLKEPCAQPSATLPSRGGAGVLRLYNVDELELEARARTFDGRVFSPTVAEQLQVRSGEHGFTSMVWMSENRAVVANRVAEDAVPVTVDIGGRDNAFYNEEQLLPPQGDALSLLADHVCHGRVVSAHVISAGTKTANVADTTSRFLTAVAEGCGYTRAGPDDAHEWYTASASIRVARGAGPGCVLVCNTRDGGVEHATVELYHASQLHKLDRFVKARNHKLASRRRLCFAACAVLERLKRRHRSYTCVWYFADAVNDLGIVRAGEWSVDIPFPDNRSASTASRCAAVYNESQLQPHHVFNGSVVRSHEFAATLTQLRGERRYVSHEWFHMATASDFGRVSGDAVSHQVPKRKMWNGNAGDDYEIVNGDFVVAV
jgi:hypothetical protein